MPNLAPLTKREAVAHTEAHKKYIATVKRDRLHRYYLISQDIDAGVPKLAGYTLKDWLVYIGIGISVSHFMRRLRAVRALPEKTLEKMPEANANELTKLPEELIRKPETIARAIAEEPAKFEQFVAKKTGNVKEGWTTIAIRVPDSVYSRWEAATAKVAEILGVDLSDEGTRGRGQIEVIEAIAQLINGTDEAILKTEITGGE